MLERDNHICNWLDVEMGCHAVSKESGIGEDELQ